MGWVCDGLIQTHIAMKQHCMGGSCYTLFTGHGGLKVRSSGHRNDAKNTVAKMWQMGLKNSAFIFF